MGGTGHEVELPNLVHDCDSPESASRARPAAIAVDRGRPGALEGSQPDQEPRATATSQAGRQAGGSRGRQVDEATKARQHCRSERAGIDGWLSRWQGCCDVRSGTVDSA